jgi:hypothetical protein
MVASESRVASISTDKSLLLLLEEIDVETSSPSSKRTRIASAPLVPTSNNSVDSDHFNPQIPEDDSESPLEDEITPELKRRAAAKSVASPRNSRKSKVNVPQPDLWVTVDRDTGISTEEAISTETSAGITKTLSKTTRRTINNTTVLRHPNTINASSEVTVLCENARTSSHESTTPSEPRRESVSKSLYQRIQLAREQNSVEVVKKSKIVASEVTTPFRKWNSRTDLDIALRTKLVDDFPQDVRSLTRIAQAVNVPSNALHVFIDFSNIYIGFITKIRRILNIGREPRLSNQYLNIDIETLVAILHRGRPTQKRILSGSKSSSHDMESVFYKEFEKTYGYNVEQLKRHAITDRQTGHQAPSSSAAGIQGNALSSNDKSRRTSPDKQLGKKHKEQGVDESLHTQILTSLLDFSEPATIVLATGDGAQSTFQTGFAECLKRALSKGWSVEVASWSESLSSVYQRGEWLGYAKQGKFKIINLDKYVDFLLGLPNDT